MRWNRRNQLLFVTGGSGFVGRHLTQSSSLGQWEVVAPSSATVDITSPERVREQIRQWKPKAVVHLAYRKDDPRVIIGGSVNVARAAAEVGARLVHVSTDVVFGGRALPYTEHDAPTPSNDYGRWKADAEAEVMAVDPGALIVRTSLVYGTERLASIQLDVERALRGQASTTFFTDEFRCPVHAADLTAALAELARRPELTGSIHVAGPQSLSRADFARHVASWMGFDPAQLRTSTIAESGMQRPANVVLDTSYAASLGITCRSVAEVLRR
jgi:dTDP-4-dehydrorhamnose reductase